MEFFRDQKIRVLGDQCRTRVHKYCTIGQGNVCSKNSRSRYLVMKVTEQMMLICCWQDIHRCPADCHKRRIKSEGLCVRVMGRASHWRVISWHQGKPRRDLCRVRCMRGGRRHEWQVLRSFNQLLSLPTVTILQGDTPRVKGAPGTWWSKCVNPSCQGKRVGGCPEERFKEIRCVFAPPHVRCYS